MSEITMDMGAIQDVDSYVNVPEGVYEVKVAEVRTGVAKDQSPRWTMRLEAAEGEYAGRTVTWDALTWSERGKYRVKKVLEVLGFDVSGEVRMSPGDLLGRKAVVEARIEEWENPGSGKREVRLRVPYLGWSSLEQAQGVDSWGGHGQ